MECPGGENGLWVCGGSLTIPLPTPTPLEGRKSGRGSSFETAADVGGLGMVGLEGQGPALRGLWHGTSFVELSQAPPAAPLLADMLTARAGAALASGRRGLVWLTVNHLIVESLPIFHPYNVDDLQVECPARSGTFITIAEVAAELARRLTRLFLKDANGRRPALAGLQRELGPLGDRFSDGPPQGVALSGDLRRSPAPTWRPDRRPASAGPCDEMPAAAPGSWRCHPGGTTPAAAPG